MFEMVPGAGCWVHMDSPPHPDCYRDLSLILKEGEVRAFKCATC